MKWSSDSANVFTFGDLVLDHFIPVAEKEGPFQPVGHERGFNGRPRRTITGGAATCARLIAALSRGRACLWGLSGHSPWGSFVEILQRSQAQSGAGQGVIFYGAHNEAHQNTITRVVSTDAQGIRSREFRIDDVHFVPVTDSQARDALGYLQAERDEHGVDAIILNDLDMKSLNDKLIQDIGLFAKANEIPLFVDPKRNWHKYRSIHVTCALPNLAEWCHIVDEPGSEARWRADLLAGRSLERMAVRCLRHMPNAEWHVIKCDKDGAVLVSPAGAGRRRIHHILPHPTTKRRLPGQLGAGDVLVAALALDYSAADSGIDLTDRMLSSLGKANAVVACYLEMDWQQVPTERDLERFRFRETQIKRTTETTDGVLLLPPSEHEDVELQKYAVLGSDLVSLDSSYTATFQQLVEFLAGGWDGSSPRSAILTGRGGVGKSDLLEILLQILPASGIDVWSDFEPSRKKCPDVGAAMRSIQRRLAHEGRNVTGLLIVVDEAFSTAGHLLFGENGKILLQALSRCEPRTRFLFIDADYTHHRSDVSQSQFVNRCKVFEVPSLASRHCDIPYIFAAGCLKSLRKNGIESARISEAVLLAVINWVLKTPDEEQSPRVLVDRAAEIASIAVRDHGDKSGPPEISKRHLPADLRTLIGEALGPKRFLRFSWVTDRSNRRLQPPTAPHRQRKKQRLRTRRRG